MRHPPVPRALPHFRKALRWLVLAVVLKLAPMQAVAETLRFCYDPYPPYTIVEDRVLTGGIKVALLEAVVDRIDGLDATVEILPWPRCQAAVELGELDGILPLFPNEKRRGYMAFTADVLQEKSVFWYSTLRFPEGLIWGRDFNALASLRLGMLQGSFIDSEMERAFRERGVIERAGSVEALFRMLRHERVDLVATDLAVGRFIAAQLGPAEAFAWIDPPIAAKASQFGLGRATGATRHVEAFNQAIRALAAEGKIERIAKGE